MTQLRIFPTESTLPSDTEHADQTAAGLHTSSAGRSSARRSAIHDWRRLAGLAVGIGTQAFFAITVVGLFSFLRYGVVSTGKPWLLTDAVLALQFAIPHSILLHPTTRRRLKPWISSEFHGVFFCICTCISLLLIFRYWQASSVVLWDLDGPASAVMLTGFFLSWAGLLYSISLTGLGFQTGWTQWLHWYRGAQIPRRDFVPRGVYHVLRHPIYLSFLGLIWFTPTMSLDHALLTAIWTVYIAVGSMLKDRRLLFYLGDSYGQYMADVPGYPGITFGPLGRISSASDTPVSRPTAA